MWPAVRAADHAVLTVPGVSRMRDMGKIMEKARIVRTPYLGVGGGPGAGAESA